MAGWIIKMMLKVFKPFIKIAIIQALLGSLFNGGEETAEEETSLEPAEDTTE